MPNIELVGSDTYNSLKRGFKRNVVEPVSDAEWDYLQTVRNPTTGILLFQESDRVGTPAVAILTPLVSDLLAAGLGEFDTASSTRTLAAVVLTPEEQAEQDELDAELAARAAANGEGDALKDPETPGGTEAPADTTTTTLPPPDAPAAPAGEAPKPVAPVTLRKAGKSGPLAPPAPPVNAGDAVTVD